MTPDNNPAQRFEARARELIDKIYGLIWKADGTAWNMDILLAKRYVAAEFAAIDREAREWRTIDSAPKDGQPFIAIRNDRSLRTFRLPRLVFIDSHGALQKWPKALKPPTHWMPLPEDAPLPSPPETEGKV